jgi:hypothetical protein
MVGGGDNSQAHAAALVDVGVEKLLCGIFTLSHAFHTKLQTISAHKHYLYLFITVLCLKVYLLEIPRNSLSH